MDLKFRNLRADEVECRVSTCKETGVQLLLYKDARCDMNILDEVVGPMNWQRSHSRDNANCIVSIWDEDKKQWISKEDTGTESNTEKEKGQASDSFKRACFNWGIGRELYTGPFIWIPADRCNIRACANGKPQCYDKFTVTDMAVENGRITKLVIKTKDVVFQFVCENKEEPKKAEPKKVEKPVPKPKTVSRDNANLIVDMAIQAGVNLDAILKMNGCEDVFSLSPERASALYGQLKAVALKRGNAKS